MLIKVKLRESVAGVIRVNFPPVDGRTITGNKNVACSCLGRGGRGGVYIKLE